MAPVFAKKAGWLGATSRAYPLRSDCFARSARLFWAPYSQGLGSHWDVATTPDGLFHENSYSDLFFESTLNYFPMFLHGTPCSCSTGWKDCASPLALSTLPTRSVKPVSSTCKPTPCSADGPVGCIAGRRPATRALHQAAPLNLPPSNKPNGSSANPSGFGVPACCIQRFRRYQPAR